MNDYLFRNDLYETLKKYSLPAITISSQNNLIWDTSIHPQEFLEENRGKFAGGLRFELLSESFHDISRVLVNKTKSKNIRIISFNSNTLLSLYTYLSSTIDHNASFHLEKIFDFESEYILDGIKKTAEFHKLSTERMPDTNLESYEIISDPYNVENFGVFEGSNSITFLDLPLGFKGKEKNFIVNTIKNIYKTLPEGSHFFTWLTPSDYKKLVNDHEILDDKFGLRINLIIDIGQYTNISSVEGMLIDISKNTPFKKWGLTLKKTLWELHSSSSSYNPGDEMQKELKEAMLSEDFSSSSYFPVAFDKNNPESFSYLPAGDFSEDNSGIQQTTYTGPQGFISFKHLRAENDLFVEKLNYSFDYVPFNEVCQIQRIKDEDINLILKGELKSYEYLFGSFGKFTKQFASNKNTESSSRSLQTNYRKIIFDNTKIAKTYVDFFENSILGKKILEASKKGFIPKISFKDLENLEVPVFNETFQTQQIQIVSTLKEFKMLLNNLEDERWSISPKEVESRLVEKLENYQNEYNYAFIPHPIATSFYWASSANNPQEKYSRLETAFECSAHFYMSILFSVTEGTSDEFKDNIYDAIKRSSLKERNTLFDQTSFGDSVRLSQAIASQLRKSIKSEKSFKDSGLDNYFTFKFLIDLVAKKNYETLSFVKDMRNEVVHKGAITTEDYEQKIEILTNERNSFLKQVEALWRQCDIIKPTTLGNIDNIKTFEYVIVTNVASHFPNPGNKKTTIKDLSQDSLYLLGKDIEGSAFEPLEVIPLLRPERSKQDVDSVYFFNKRPLENESLFVSYSAQEADPELKIENTNKLNSFFNKINRLENKET